MIVSFDLDDTLFVDPEKVETEPPMRFPFRLIFKEKLRRGTVRLFSEIQKRNHNAIIYTSSYRSASYIQGYFRYYGIRLSTGDIINGKRHADEVQRDRKEILPSKIPSRYGSELHIDDDTSVKQNGQVYGFNVYLIHSEDAHWVENILQEIELVERRKHRLAGSS